MNIIISYYLKDETNLFLNAIFIKMFTMCILNF